MIMTNVKMLKYNDIQKDRKIIISLDAIRIGTFIRPLITAGDNK